MPSHEAVMSFELSCGSQTCWMTTSLCAWSRLSSLPFFQSQKTTVPSAVPDEMYFPSGEKPMPQA